MRPRSYQRSEPHKCLYNMDDDVRLFLNDRIRLQTRFDMAFSLKNGCFHTISTSFLDRDLPFPSSIDLKNNLAVRFFSLLSLKGSLRLVKKKDGIKANDDIPRVDPGSDLSDLFNTWLRIKERGLDTPAQPRVDQLREIAAWIDAGD